jgi:3,4-dehydroadipyl-CoA semialdehyde dehydrogenase
MKTLKSHVCGQWFEPKGELAELYDPCTEEPIAGASTAGIDFQEALDYARNEGGTRLRKMTFAERGAVLEGMYKALIEAREPLIDASLTNTGSTRKDAKFDVDGAAGVLKYYSYLAGKLGDSRVLVDGEGAKLGRSARFWGQHIRVPLEGAAVLINAFNFPLWGYAEKAAASILAGIPVIIKPATSTAFVTECGYEIMVNAGAVPDGVASLISGSAGDLLNRLGSQDVVAFTGSSGTAMKIRSNENLLRSNTRVNVEADSLNAAVLGPDLEPGAEAWKLFLMDVRREVTQKSGQKCTAVRRIFVPKDRADEIQAELIASLNEVVVGNPMDSSVTMGPLATADQLKDTIDGAKALSADAEMVHGTGDRVDGVGAESGKGYFFGPTLFRAEDGRNASGAHEREVFGPVATILPYDGSATEAARLVAMGGGCLVTSVYSDDNAFVGEFIAEGGSHSGRLYLGSEKMAEQAFGSGIAMPQSMHGGPGRAGFGEELGDLRALNLYTQRVALQGGHRMIQSLIGSEEDKK